MRHISSFQAFEQCVQQCRNLDMQYNNILVHIIRFLAEVIKTATDLTLVSYAFYAITCFALRLLGLPVDAQGSKYDQSIAEQNPQNFLKQELFSLLRDSV